MNIAERQKCATLFYNEVKNYADSYVVESVGYKWRSAEDFMEDLSACVKNRFSWDTRVSLLLRDISRFLIDIACLKDLAAIDPFIDNALATMACKGHDYAVEDNAYRDFEDTAEALGITVPQVIMVHMRKHWAALCNYRDGKVIQGDPIVTKFMDMCNYCAILDAWLREQAARETACDELTQ